MSKVIRIDPEVYGLTVRTQGLLMQATGGFVSASDAIRFLLALKEWADG